MENLDKIAKKYNLDLTQRSPIEIPNMGRQQLAELFAELGFKIGVEIGVRDGSYSLALMQTIPDLKLYGIDPYLPHAGYRDITRQQTFDAYEAQAHAKLDSYPNYKFVKEFSMDALEGCPDNSLDFVYIDGDHCFEEVTKDIAGWSKKVKPGGIISGDDYFKHAGEARIHVYQVVRGYTEAWHIAPWFVVGSKAIIEGEFRDHGRSWFWIQQG